jgi:uncharacterized low-complexity protein
MRSKLALSALIVASLFGTTAIASAQTTPAPGASSEGNVGPGAARPMGSTNGMSNGSMSNGSGMTTGTSRMGNGSQTGTARNPSSEGNVGPGTNNNSGPAPGGR